MQLAKIQMQLIFENNFPKNPNAIGEFFKNSESTQKNPNAIGENPIQLIFLKTTQKHKNH